MDKWLVDGGKAVRNLSAMTAKASEMTLSQRGKLCLKASRVSGFLLDV